MFNMFKKSPERVVAIATDGSDNSKAAFKYYVKDLRKDGDKVVLLHSVEMNPFLQTMHVTDPPFNFGREMLPKLLEEEQVRAQQKIDNISTWCKEQGIEGTVKAVHSESPGEGIIKAAEEHNASLIVMGTRGLGTLRKTILGSVSDYVLHHTKLPVLICKPENEGKKE